MIKIQISQPHTNSPNGFGDFNDRTLQWDINKNSLFEINIMLFLFIAFLL